MEDKMAAFEVVFDFLSQPNESNSGRSYCLPTEASTHISMIYTDRRFGIWPASAFSREQTPPRRLCA
jgi:hypothetical protein